MVNKLINKVLAMAAIVCINYTSNAQTTNSFSAKQTVDYGLKNAIQVKNALIDIQAQAQSNREFTAVAYPQLNASIGTTHYFDIPVQAIPNFISPATYGVLVHEGVKNGNGTAITIPNGGNFGVIAAQFGTPWTATGGFDISQILFDGQVFVGLKARSAAMELASKTAEVTKEQIKINIYKIYYQLIVGKAQMASVDANIDRFNKLLHDTKEIYKNGFVEKLDVDKIEVALNNLTTEKEKINNQLAAGNEGLKFLIGMPQKEILQLTDTLNEAEIKADMLDTTFKYEDRKEVQLLHIATKLNEYNIKRYQLSKLPTVVAFGSYNKNAQRSQFDFFGKGNWYTTSLIGLKINMPIFDGFARRARIENAKLSLQKTQNNIVNTKQRIDYEVNTATINMKSAMLTMENQKKNIELAEKVYNNTKKKYEQGLGTNTDIYTAQAELKVAQTNFYNAIYDVINAKLDWSKAVGRL